MMRQEIRETTGQYLSELIQMELTDFLGQRPYEHYKGEVLTTMFRPHLLASNEFTQRSLKK